MNETQVIAMVMSADPAGDPGVLALPGAAAALAISEIPFHHILAGVRVGKIDGKLLANPNYEEAKGSTMNLMVAGTKDGIVMVEAGAFQVSEAGNRGAIDFGHDCCRRIIAGIEELVAKVGKKKWDYKPAKSAKSSLPRSTSSSALTLPTR